MSFTPWQPPDTHPNPKRDFRRVLFALALLALAAGGLTLLSISFGYRPDQAATSPTPTAVAEAATPRRGQGLSGPQPPTATLVPEVAALTSPTVAPTAT